MIRTFDSRNAQTCHQTGSGCIVGNGWLSSQAHLHLPHPSVLTASSLTSFQRISVGSNSVLLPNYPPSRTEMTSAGVRLWAIDERLKAGTKNRATNPLYLAQRLLHCIKSASKCRRPPANLLRANALFPFPQSGSLSPEPHFSREKDSVACILSMEPKLSFTSAYVLFSSLPKGQTELNRFILWVTN